MRYAAFHLKFGASAAGPLPPGGNPTCATDPLLSKAIVAKVALTGRAMQHISAREAKNSFGRLIDLARAAPVSVDKHGRPVVVVLSVEEYERLLAQSEKNGTNA